MENIEILAKKNKLIDIESVTFGSDLQEIVTSMEIILTMYQIDEDTDIVKACKDKLIEGLNLLKTLGQFEKIKDFEIEKNDSYL